MSVRHAILGLLASRPLHGYELKAAYQEEFSPTSDLNFGQVYSSLDRLLRDGLVECEIVAQPTRPERKIFTITKDGLLELRAWLESSKPIALDLRNETFFKLIIARALGHSKQNGVSVADPGTAQEIIVRERKRALAQLHEVVREPRKETSLKPAESLLLTLAELRLEAYLKWLDHADELARTPPEPQAQRARANGAAKRGESKRPGAK